MITFFTGAKKREPLLELTTSAFLALDSSNVDFKCLRLQGKMSGSWAQRSDLPLDPVEEPHETQQGHFCLSFCLHQCACVYIGVYLHTLDHVPPDEPSHCPSMHQTKHTDKDHCLARTVGLKAAEQENFLFISHHGPDGKTVLEEDSVHNSWWCNETTKNNFRDTHTHCRWGFILWLCGFKQQCQRFGKIQREFEINPNKKLY